MKYSMEAHYVDIQLLLMSVNKNVARVLRNIWQIGIKLRLLNYYDKSFKFGKKKSSKIIRNKGPTQQ